MRQKLATLLALLTTACNGWRVESGPTPAATEKARDRAPTIRLRLKDGRSLDLVGAKVIGDSVVGYNRDNRSDFARHAVAVNDVTSVATYGPDGPATAMLVLAIVGATVALVVTCAASFAE